MRVSVQLGDVRIDLTTDLTLAHSSIIVLCFQNFKRKHLKLKYILIYRSILFQNVKVFLKFCRTVGGKLILADD